ncbi:MULTISPECIES: hypothetical protein [Citrobacter]|uniref:hypothetical protein n=1 Tax=Citrobacter TaxID=544 RepID=UPI0019002A1F|nr:MULTISPECIES: hypothetical protein [Citrobacter]MBJ9134443.1 hypothetical protein [Citrobacter farmeri]MDM2738373.1 hypothetical protein [Citrobacter sp. Ct235]
MKEWLNTDVIKPEDTYIVYLMMFQDGSYYVGQKSLFKGRVKNPKKSKESDWRTYQSSSTTVHNLIDKGYECERIVLCGTNKKSYVNLIETLLILQHGLDTRCLNLAFQSRGKLPSEANKHMCKELLNIAQTTLQTYVKS